MFSAAELAPVIVTRRDGEDLVLMSSRDDSDRRELFGLAAQLIGINASETAGVKDRLSTIFPWMLSLSQQDRQKCAAEILESAMASLATDQPRLATLLLRSWQETAEAVAAGLVGASEWLDTPREVPRP